MSRVQQKLVQGFRIPHAVEARHLSGVTEFGNRSDSPPDDADQMRTDAVLLFGDGVTGLALGEHFPPPFGIAGRKQGREIDFLGACARCIAFQRRCIGEFSHAFMLAVADITNMVEGFGAPLAKEQDQQCAAERAEWEPMPCATFEDAVDVVRSGEAELAMLPVENTIYGRVADIHRLLPESGLHIVEEAFLRIHINVLAPPGSELSEIRSALSHVVLLGQCRNFFREKGITPVAWSDTAGSAMHVAEANDRTVAALASGLAAEAYGLEILVENIEDERFNRTRFLVMSREADRRRRSADMMTSFVFRVRNIPAALYKALGGFATNKVNIVKLESYMLGGVFFATQFFAEIEGHPDDPEVVLAMDELQFFTDYLKILGVYPAAPDRHPEHS